jgi:glycosyltransferase involved in cell wall biosynthesis
VTSLQPTVVFPAAHKRGGVERAVLETLRYLGSRHPTTFVGHELELPSSDAEVRHLVPRRSPWARGALRPVEFRIHAASVVPEGPGIVTISHGVESPPGDVYHVHSLQRAWLAAGRAVTVRGVRVPNAVRYALPHHQVLLALEWEYFQRHHPRRILAPSSGLAQDLENFYGVPADIIEIVPYGFDPAQCNPSRRVALRDQERAAARINPDAIIVLFVANELHRKGFGTLLEAVGSLQATPIEIHVFGRTPLDAFQARIDQLNLNDRVRFHGATQDVGRAHALGDFFVLPTQYETFGIVALEALASGLPVIVPRRTPGAGEIVRDDENGLLQEDPTDVDELRSLLVKALDPESRARWSANASASVVDLTWSRLGARVERVLLDLI